MVTGQGSLGYRSGFLGVLVRVPWLLVSVPWGTGQSSLVTGQSFLGVQVRVPCGTSQGSLGVLVRVPWLLVKGSLVCNVCCLLVSPPRLVVSLP